MAGHWSLLTFDPELLFPVRVGLGEGDCEQLYVRPVTAPRGKLRTITVGGVGNGAWPYPLNRVGNCCRRTLFRGWLFAMVWRLENMFFIKVQFCWV